MIIPGVVRRMYLSSLSTVTTKYIEAFISIFGAYVHHVFGFGLLGIGDTLYTSYKIMAQKPNFDILNFSLRPLTDGT